MVDEVIAALSPRPGDLAIDCTLGGGGHAQAILERIRPGGRLIGLDVDPIELPRTEARLRAAGCGPDVFAARQADFQSLPDVLAREGGAAADVVLADLGVSAMQHDDAARGFHYKQAGPLDMRMNPSGGETAAELIARLSEEEVAALLDENADEPHAALIARVITRQSIATTHALERAVRTALNRALPGAPRSAVKMSVRRTFQALRIAVNGEMAALDALLRALPQCLAPGARVAVVTFHSGEDRRVKKAFQAGRRDGVYAAVAGRPVRSSMDESRTNRRSRAAKLRWAMRA